MKMNASLIALCFTGAFSIGAALACNVGETVYGQWYQFRCPSTSQSETRNYCIKLWKDCAVPDVTEYCAWNWYDDVGAEADFPDAEQFYADCKDIAGVEDGRDPIGMPGYSCSGSGSATAGGSAGATSTSGDATGGETTGTPTTSATSTDTTGGGDGKVKWLCAKNAHLKCADLVPDDALGDDVVDNTALDECWGALSTDSEVFLAPCVDAPAGEGGQDNARMQCQTLCEARKKAINTNMLNVCGTFDEDCKIAKEIDCVLDGYVNGQEESWDEPAKLSESSGWDCEGGMSMVPVWLGQSNFVVFHGSGTLITPDGVSAGLSNISGALAYELSDCTTTQCTITIDALQGFTYTAEGGYVDASGAGGTYKLEQMGFQGASVISGTWNKLRGTVTFPSAVLDAQFWVGPVSMNGLEVSSLPEAHSIPIDQMVGSLRDETSPLTLNMTYNSDFGTVNLSLQTVPPV